MNISAFSPHPDDVEVMMGGTIAKYTQKGHKVLIVLVTIPDQKEIRTEEAKKSAAILGAHLSILDLNPDELVFNRKLVGIFDRILQDFLPDIIYTSWFHDSHQDHIAVSRATIAGARKNQCSVYMYDQALPSGLTPDTFRLQSFVDISDTMEVKRRSLSAYQSQLQKYGENWLETIVARASYRGYLINTKYAEGFETVKEIQQI